MTGQEFLLDDAGIQRFIVDGYLTVHADYPAPFHDAIYQQIESVFDQEGNPGNNILPRVPQLQQVFEHPVVKGALTSLLGPGYILNPHRHCHLNPPGRKGQRWHKDCYVYDHNVRHPRFSWLLAFYYPQDTTEDMGPSGVLPGSQMYKTLSDVDPAKTQEKAQALCGPAGTVALVHFDAWHRATENVSPQKRYMVKFQFARTREPDAPVWNHRNRSWVLDIPDKHPGISRDVWDWLCGGRSKPEANTKVHSNGVEKAISEQMDQLGNASETVRLEAACALAEMGAPAVTALAASMRREALETIEETTATTPDNAHGTNPTSGCAALALSMIGPAAIPYLVAALGDDHWWVRAVAIHALARMGAEARVALDDVKAALGDDHWWVRRNAVEALGMMGVSSADVVDVLVRAVTDSDYRVRRNAALGLSKIGSDGTSAMEHLVGMLGDENRYNRFYAAHALRQIGTPEAQQKLMDTLFAARWCPITTKDNMY